MEHPVFSQHLKTLLLACGGLGVAVVAGWNLGSGNYEAVIFATVILAAASLVFFSGQFFWILAVASSFLGGTFPILGGSFTPFQILMALGIIRFIAGDIILKRATIKYGPVFDRLMIAGFIAVLTLHAAHDRFGMRFLGSNIWGGRNYVNVYIGLAAFFVIQSVPMRSKLWAKLPYIVLAVTTFDLIIAVITTIFPASIYKIYPFYSAVSRAGLEEIVTGNPVETQRVGAIGNFGFILILLVLASTSLRRLFTLSSFLRLLTVIVALIAVLYSSFRSTVLNTLSAVVVAGIRDLKFKVVLLLLFLVFCLVGLSLLNSQVVRLPKQVQRSLTFLPGDWDANMTADANDSNEFRRRVWTLWAQDYFPVHPLLGRGFGFRSEWAQGTERSHSPEESHQMVEVGNIHNGLFATLDAFGVIGTIFFIIWNVVLLVRAMRVPFDDRYSGAIALRFLSLYLATLIISYWIGAMTVGIFLPQEFALVGVFLSLQRSIKLESASEQHSPPKVPEALAGI